MDFCDLTQQCEGEGARKTSISCCIRRLARYCPALKQEGGDETGEETSAGAGGQRRLGALARLPRLNALKMFGSLEVCVCVSGANRCAAQKQTRSENHGVIFRS